MPADFNPEKEMAETDKLEQAYQQLMERARPVIPIQPQWASQGHYFVKFSLYPEYVPSHTSDHTPVMGNI